jgi:chromosome segregation ATPase
MKRDFIKSLGIEDKEVIDKILDENSADIGRAKGELDAYKTKVTELESQLKGKDTELEKLQKSVGDTDALNSKIAQLETEKTQLSTELNTKLTDLKKTYAVENKVREAKARNVKAVMALLDQSKITYENEVLGGVDEQLTALQGGDDTKFLFGDVQAPTGTHPGNPPAGAGNPPTSKSLTEAIAKRFQK